MGEDIDMAELSMAMPEKLNTDLPEDIFQSELAGSQLNAHSSPVKGEIHREHDSTNSPTPKCKTISESSSQDIGLFHLQSIRFAFLYISELEGDTLHRPMFRAVIQCFQLFFAKINMNDVNTNSVYIVVNTRPRSGHKQSKKKPFHYRHLIRPLTEKQST